MAKIKMRRVWIEPFDRVVHVAVGDNPRDTINLMLKALKIPVTVPPNKYSKAAVYTVDHDGRTWRLMAFQKTMSVGFIAHEVFHIVNAISFDGTGDPIGEGSDESYAYTLEVAVERVSKAIHELGGEIKIIGKDRTHGRH